MNQVGAHPAIDNGGGLVLRLRQGRHKRLVFGLGVGVCHGEGAVGHHGDQNTGCNGSGQSESRSIGRGVLVLGQLGAVDEHHFAARGIGGAKFGLVRGGHRRPFDVELAATHTASELEARTVIDQVVDGTHTKVTWRQYGTARLDHGLGAQAIDVGGNGAGAGICRFEAEGLASFVGRHLHVERRGEQ